VLGVGGAGVNAVARLQDVGLDGVRFAVVDTSTRALRRAGAAQAVPLPACGGLGTGGDPEAGARAARAAATAISAAVAGADLTFLVCGLSGGTGGGAGPEVARIAAGSGGVVIGFGFTPFDFEAARAAALAGQARARLAAACTATVVLDNRRAMALAGAAVPADVALRVADDVLRQAVTGLTDLVTRSGPIDADLATVREVLARGGECCLALGVGRGPAAATRAMRAALRSPLADMDALGRAPAVLAQVTGGADLRVGDTAQALELLRARLAADAFLVVGTGLDDTLQAAAQVTLLATGWHGGPTASDSPAGTAPGDAAERFDWRRRAEALDRPEPLPATFSTEGDEPQ
jgi:cell division protein FtsZ